MLSRFRFAHAIPRILLVVAASTVGITGFSQEAIEDLQSQTPSILREHVLGREAFDHAFKTYAKRWMFKRPTPSDFFRTMEDASGVDLDWFWRGWFYSVDHVDVSIDEVKWLQLDSRDPAIEKTKKKQKEDEQPKTTAKELNQALPKRIDRFPELKDFYDAFDETTVLPSEKKKFDALIKELLEEEIDPALLQAKHNFYSIQLRNLGGLVTPVILKIEYTDASVEELKLPAEIWRFNTENTHLLAQEINEQFFQLTGQRPYVVIAQGPRAQIDFNRAEGSSAFEVEAARPYHQYYHNTVRSYVDQIRGQWTSGLLIDIHGHGVSGSTDVIFRGTRDGDTVEDMLALHGEVALNGPKSFLGKLAALGHTVDPDVALPLAQQREEDGLTGAFTVLNYGSQNSNGIDAIQFELGRDFRFGTAWQTFAPSVALAANTYRTNFLSTAAIPEPASLVLVFSMSVFITTRRLRYRLDARHEK